MPQHDAPNDAHLDLLVGVGDAGALEAMVGEEFARSSPCSRPFVAKASCAPASTRSASPHVPTWAC